MGALAGVVRRARHTRDLRSIATEITRKLQFHCAVTHCLRQIPLPSRSNIGLHLIKQLFHFRPRREIFVQVEKILELKLLQRNRVRLADRQARHLERLLHPPAVVFVGCK